MHHCTTQITTTGLASCKALALVVAIATSLPAYVAAAEPATARVAVVNFDIPMGDLSIALERFSTQSGRQVMYRQDLIAGKRAHAVNGAHSPEAALSQLLAGTGLISERVNATTYVLKVAAEPAPANRGLDKERKSREQIGESAHGGEVKDLDDVVVVGSRLGTSPVESALPVKMITREDIERSGASGIAQILSYLPEVSVSNAPNLNIGDAGPLSGSNINASSVQLRGLPLGTTLVLIDGRRAGDSSALASSGQFDLSTIPLAMVERIEVLPAGASAIYGGDGLAGVINIVLRSDYELSEVRVRNLSAEGYSERQISGVWGKTWSRGSISAMASWTKNGDFLSSERQLTWDKDYRRYGGYDRRSTYYSYPANIYSLDGCNRQASYCFIPLNQRGNLPGLTHSFAMVPTDQNGLDLESTDFLATAGTLNYGDRETKFRTAETAYSVSMGGTFDLNDSAEIFGNLLFTKRGIPAREIGLEILSGEYADSRSIVPSGNPFNPFGVDVGVDYYFSDTNIFTDYEQKHQRIVVGARGEWGKSHWEVSASSTKDRTIFNGPSSFSSALVSQALRSTNEQTALNVFAGDGSAPGSRELLLSLLNTAENGYEGNSNSVTAYIRGEMATLPAGALNALVGIDLLETSYESAYQGSTRIKGEDRSRAIYTEARAPLLSSESEGVKRDLLALTGALRREWIDRSEKEATTGTVGFEFRPSPTVMLRGSYSEAFKPIVAYTAYQDTVPLTYTTLINDPKFAGRPTPVYQITGGGVPPGLRPETSSTFTLGVIWTPSRDFRTSITAWQTNLEDKFVLLSQARSDVQYVVDHEHDYPGRVIRNAQTDAIERVDMRVMNMASTRTSGIDLSIDGRTNTRAGELVATLGATYTYEYNEKRLKTSPEVSRLSVLGLAGWAPKWKIVPKLAWYPDDTISMSAIGRYISRYDDTLKLVSGPNAGKAPRLGNFWVVDLSLSVDVTGWLPFGSSVLDSAKFRVYSNNVGNKLPDFCNSCSSGYDATQYDIMGRSVGAELIVGF